MSDEPLKISAFITAMRDRFMGLADLTEDQATIAAVNSLEAWEDMEPVELTEDFAHGIVDSELEHWDD